MIKTKMITSTHWDEDWVEMYKDKATLRAKRKHTCEEEQEDEKDKEKL